MALNAGATHASSVITTSSPLINAKAVASVADLIGDAVGHGARVETGGRPHALGGTWFEPTVLTGMQSSMRLAREEAFGPVAPVTRFSSIDEAASLAAETDYGLSLGIVTRDVMKGLALADRIPSGIVHINDQTVSDEANARASSLTPWVKSASM